MGEAKLKGTTDRAVFTPRIVVTERNAYQLMRDGRVFRILLGARIRDDAVISKVHASARSAEEQEALQKKMLKGFEDAEAGKVSSSAAAPKKPRQRKPRSAQSTGEGAQGAT